MKKVWKPGNMLYPVPAVMVTVGEQKSGVERDNIITVAWAGTVNSDPPMVSISVRKSRYSHELLAASGEFAINLVTEGLCRAMDYCGVKSGRDTDKFEACRLTRGKAETIGAPLIEESPVNIECRVKQVVELGSHDMFIAEVTAVQVDEAFIDEKGLLDMSRMKLIAYNHGEYNALGAKIGSFGYSVRKKKNNHKSGQGKKRKK